MTDKPRLEIRYCTQCRWLLRAAWMLQELLLTFEAELSEAALVPGTGGVFEVQVDGETIWSRTDRGRFPELKEVEAVCARSRRSRQGTGTFGDLIRHVAVCEDTA